MPKVTLNQQGRTRPQLAQLFAWRYDGLGNLPNVKESTVGQSLYASANCGFAHTFQAFPPLPILGI